MRPHRRQPTRLPVPGILQARTLEWVAISFSNDILVNCLTTSSLSVILTWILVDVLVFVSEKDDFKIFKLKLYQFADYVNTFFAEPADNFLTMEEYFFLFCATHNETATNITYLYLIFIISFSFITFLGLDRQLTK